jgi:hypothetical protein
LEKTQLARIIVEKIHERGGRFLKQEGAGWVEIDDETARTKVSHTFRNHRIAARTALKKAAVAQDDIDAGLSEQRRRSQPDDVKIATSFGLEGMFAGQSPIDQKRRRIDYDL